MNVMVRQAEDDFEALFIAMAMEKLGGNVFSVAYNGQHRRLGAMIDCSKFLVWCKYEGGDEFCNQVDELAEELKK